MKQYVDYNQLKAMSLIDDYFPKHDKSYNLPGNIFTPTEFPKPRKIGKKGKKE